jgi:transposase
LKKLNLDVDKLCEEYLADNTTTKDLAEKYQCDIGTIINRLKNSSNKLVVEKLTRQWLTNSRKLNLDMESIIKDRENGLSFTEIALKYGCHKETARRRYLQYINGEVNDTPEKRVIKNKNLKPENVANDYLQEGMSTFKLAQIYGCDMETVRRRIQVSKNELAIEKLKTNQDRNPSEIYIKDRFIYVVAINTGNEFKFNFSEELLDQLKYHGNWREDNMGYLYSSSKVDDFFKAHWLVIGRPEEGYEVDHKDLNKKNNVKNNLRIVTKSGNRHNYKTKRNNTSGYHGVHYNKNDNKWVARIAIDKVRYSLGTFLTKEEAALRYFEVKYNLLGFEYMPIEEQEKYNNLLTYFATTA